VLTWIAISLFLALALNPAVEWLQRRRGLKRRGAAAAIAYLLALGFFVAIGYTFVPTLVHQVNDFVNKLPDYAHDVTHGRGRLGFLETKYHIQERIQKAVSQGGATKVLGLSGAAFSVAKSVISIVVAAITILFMTYFMLLEGPSWVERFYGVLPESSRPRWRKVGHEIYRTVGGYVTGNLLISVIAGTATTLTLLALSVPYAVVLGVIVAIFDLVPLVGATAGAVVVAAVALGTRGLAAASIAVVVMIVYQQLENHVLQQLVYHRTVKLSPLAIALSVAAGAELAGVPGALLGIPFAGALLVVSKEVVAYRRGEDAPA
jgi:predicted PurR-regulated permease PerM